MKKLILVCLTAFLMFTNSAIAEESVALVDLSFVKDTEIASHVMCYDNDNCHNWATYYIFSVNVIKVISGELPEGNFKVVFGRHALLKKDFSNVLATFEKIEYFDDYEASYKVLDWESEHDL